MRVAIIGAGISGLACAYEFKKNGILPTVYERHRYIGEDVDFVTTTLKLFDRMYEDPMIYLKDEYNIELKPLNTLTKIVMNGPSKQTFIDRTSGHVFCRGSCEYSLENQMAKIADVPITFYKQIYVDDIKNEYEYVIDATGTLDYPKQLGILTPHLSAFVRLSVISGNFEMGTIKMWMNTDYAKNCFAFLLPHSNNKACLALTVNQISQPELDYYWEKFITKENIENKIIKTFDISHETGAVVPHKVDNVFFVGKAGGFLGSVLGFGMLNSIESGALAARAIINKSNYEHLIEPIFDYVQKKYNFRKVLNTFDNSDIDKLFEFLGLPVAKQLIYNNPLAKITQITLLAKAYNRFIGNKK